jgi:4-hydroxybenzoate polyprenyltransferase
LKQAILLLTLLLFIALFIALQMNMATLLLAVCALPLVAAYPFMKRITWWPQAFLGLTFNWGALMGWVAVRGNLGWPAVALYVGGIFWTLGYDTIYAHQDKDDDSKIGVKSTALRLGAQSKYWIAGFYAAAFFAWALAGILAYSSIFYFIGLFCVTLHFAWQIKQVNLGDSLSCMRIFRSNMALGWLLFGGMIAANFYGLLSM